jgi:hypothetical protein
LIVEVPPKLLGFAHAEGLRYIDRDGQLQAGVTEEFVAADQSRARAEYLGRYAFRTGAVPARELADHAPANYLRAFF